MTNLLYTLIPILIQIESAGNDNAVGDGGRAVGCLQIHCCVIDDVNRIYGDIYGYDARLDRELSREICFKYLYYWGRKYEARTGKEPTYEVYARIWNGGPSGWAKKSTQRYWEKVRRLLYGSA